MTKMINNISKNVISVKDIRFGSGEYTLAGTFVCPANQPKAAVVLNGATAIKRRYYLPFAEWLASTQDIACLVYDYRDFGGSADGHPKASSVDMADWAVHDQQSARGYLATQLPRTPLWVMGHSLGGLALAFQNELDQVKRVITVASGPVHVSDHPWPYQAVVRLFWFGHAPLAVRALGYLPGRKLGFGNDLPAGVYWQWRKWCTTKGFFSGEFGNELPFPDWMAVKCPVKVVAVQDDAMVPPAAVWRLMQFYRDAQMSQLTLKPENYGLSKIGHIGAFAKENAACWGDLIS